MLVGFIVCTRLSCTTAVLYTVPGYCMYYTTYTCYVLLPLNYIHVLRSIMIKTYNNTYVYCEIRFTASCMYLYVTCMYVCHVVQYPPCMYVLVHDIRTTIYHQHTFHYIVYVHMYMTCMCKCRVVQYPPCIHTYVYVHIVHIRIGTSNIQDYLYIVHTRHVCAHVCTCMY